MAENEVFTRLERGDQVNEVAPGDQVNDVERGDEVDDVERGDDVHEDQRGHEVYQDHPSRRHGADRRSPGRPPAKKLKRHAAWSSIPMCAWCIAMGHIDLYSVRYSVAAGSDEACRCPCGDKS